MSNFRVIVAFNRVDYFQQQFNAANERNYTASVDRAGLANNVVHPALRPRLNLAQLIVLAYGFYLISRRQLHRRPADRLPAVREQLLHAAAPARRDLVVVPAGDGQPRSDFRQCCRSSRTCRRSPAARRPVAGPVLAFDHVQFSYVAGTPDAARRDLRARRRQDLRAGRPDRRRQDDDGVADGAALRSDRRAACCSTAATSARSRRRSAPTRIGFILQEPFLFTGTVRDNIVYGNEALQRAVRRGARARGWPPSISTACSRGSSRAWRRQVTAGGDGVSLGPEAARSRSCAPCCASRRFSILDEATANIDTVTEQLLEQILRELPRVDDQGRHRAPPEHHRERRRDLLHQRRRDHAAPARCRTRSTCCCTASGNPEA